MIERARQFGQFGLPAECPGVKFPETRQVGDGLPTDPSEAWLVKPIRSGGGLGVRAWRADETAIPAGHQLQRQINGRVVGLSYLGKGNSARYLGAIVAFQDASFHYAGGYGPLPETGLTEVFERLGTVITGNNPLRGLFGIDVILGDFDPATGLPQVWFLELNPRYTSSMELLEESLGISLMAEHARVFGIEVDGPEPSKGAALVAKQILYADRPAIVPDDIPWRVATGVPIEVADIPQQGTILAVGDPILTVFARGATEAELFDQLDRRAASWRARIAGWPATRSES
jgi:predicted ATP-grasp superfamily ATP-dependent carboligase